ncbi:MAG TPA: YbaK/EbsC family protein [Candidatus Acidoferrales bacterium]|nr:YbaK/EbsC family protein [Candidatus Acidoferrales bacterium]
MKPAVIRVQAALDALGLRRAVIELPVEARTSQQAADAVGVGVGQIAKSLVFTVDGAPVMVIASGTNRVDERKLATLAGGNVRRADADTVKRATGYTIGGVPPLGHETALRIWIDEDLLRHDLIYAAGGVSDCVFPLTPGELLKATGGSVADVKEPKSLKGEPT